MLEPATLGGDPSRILVIFLGLVSASVLPTVSLLIGNMTASSRSVLALNELNAELESAMDHLFFMFGTVALSVMALLALSIPPPALLKSIPILAAEILPRGGQITVVLGTTLLALRMGQIPAILRRSLSIRHRIAVEEAKRQTLENAPESDQIRASFATHSEFGKRVPLEQPKN